MEKEERKEYVKEQRKKFKENPQGFIKENIINPTWKYWKEEPLHALGTFFFWVAIYYVVFGGIQAINNDMIYCDSNLDQFDGKVMYVYNDFIDYYNEMAMDNSQYNSNPQMYFNYSYQQDRMRQAQLDYDIFCDYNFTKWKSETITDRIQTTGYGFKKILLKQS